MAGTARRDETAPGPDLGCDCDDNGAIDREMLELALDDGQEVELPCGHTVSPPAMEYVEPDRQLGTVERPRPLDSRLDLDRHHQSEDPVHEGRVMRVHATALSRQHSRGLNARPSRREIGEVVDEVVPFEELASLTDRARLREQVMARLDKARERIQDRQRGRGRWSL